MQNVLDIERNKLTIIDLLQSTNREGIENVLQYLEDSGFYVVPSSKHRHHNWKGGLAQHCLGVCTTALEHIEDLPRDSIIITGLLHDICKASKLYYDEDGNVHHNHTHIHGHGYRSIKLLEQCGLVLTDDERRAIRWHMGGHHANPEDYDDVRIARNSKLWKVIHEADHWDASGKNLHKK